jgi:uncharacterized membrane protein
MPVDPQSSDPSNLTARPQAVCGEERRASGWGGNPAYEKAMKLAVVCGLRALLGPALLSEARRRPERRNLALAALGELLLDKLPIMPSRKSLPMLLPRAIAGAWVAKAVMEEEGINDPWAPAMGAAVAAGVASISPLIRASLARVLDVPDSMMALAEDYLALRLGTQAVGLSLDEAAQIAGRSVEEVKDLILPAIQSVGAGSM